MNTHKSICTWLTLGILGYLTALGCATVEQFGCAFSHENYYVPTESIYSPVYGKKVKPMQFENVEEFDKFMGDVKREYAQLMEEIVFTTIPLFYDWFVFVNQTKNAELVKSQSYTPFKDYVPKFISKQGEEGMAIELLVRLIRKHRSMAESAHLITVNEKVSDHQLPKFKINVPMNPTGYGTATDGVDGGEDFADDMEAAPGDDKDLVKSKSWLQKIVPCGDNLGKTYATKEPPSELFKHSHVAAVVRIRVGRSQGYVLMDPGFGYSTPVVIMENKKPPNAPATFKDGIRTVRFHHSVGDYVVSMELSKEMTPLAAHLYYVGKPYCSFVMTTLKPKLVRTILKVVRRNSRGKPIALIRFNPTHDSPKVQLRLTGEKEVPPQKQDVISTVEFEPFKKMRQNTIFGKLSNLFRKANIYNAVKEVMDYAPLEGLLDQAVKMCEPHFADYMRWLTGFIRDDWEAFSVKGGSPSV